MREDIIHYVWKHKLYDKQLCTVEGEPIEVIDTGIHNSNAGPDFFNAKIKIGDQLWVGNVEIHHSSGDWIKHNHHRDESYDSIILHIVRKANTTIINSSGRRIPQCIITYPTHIDNNIDFLLKSDLSIPCANYISSIPKLRLSSWLNSLLIERLERKTNDIETLLQQYINSWEEVFYILLSRSFGFGINSDAFERLAKSIPLQYIRKHSNNILQLEAMLFGQAGMLEKPEDEYQKSLSNEYLFLKEKFGLTPLPSSLFKNLRIRPTAFPQVRIAQLTILLHTYPNLFNKVVYAKDVGTLRLILQVNPSLYWQTHYTFGTESPKRSKYLGDNSLDSLIINAVCPIIFSYGKHTADESICDKSLAFLENIKAENNSIIKFFKSLNVSINSAYDSQACIQLKREYCEKKKCLFCQIGHNLLTNR